MPLLSSAHRLLSERGPDTLSKGLPTYCRLTYSAGSRGAVMSALATGVSVRVMTYDDIASEMGLKPASARQLVRRNKWRRVPGNDGRTRIEVPVEELERDIKRAVEPPVETGKTDSRIPSESPFEAPLVAALSTHIERLERALADA